MSRILLVALVIFLAVAAVADTGVHTTWLWHMHQPIYWPAESGWNPGRYETAYETITLGHSQNDVFTIFNKDDRVADYQWYPKDALQSVLDLSEAGAQISFAGSLIENLSSLGDAGWNGGRYASDWWSHYRTAHGWSNAAGDSRLDLVLVGFHHAIGPLMPDAAFRMELACGREVWGDAWGSGPQSTGFFPAEMCFSERMIPAMVDAGVEWTVVPDLHIARACVGYPWSAGGDNTDTPNPADQLNPAQTNWTNHTISRGVTLRVPYPYGFMPHRAVYVDPTTGQGDTVVVVPAANAMGWEDGYGLFGTGGIDAMASANDSSRPMLVLLAHDGDNAWSGGHSYYNENVSQFAHSAAAQGYTPTTIATYLRHHPVPADDVVHVEDGGWVNADGDFGSPQYINWNWPLVDASGQFDIPGGWAEDERNWAVLIAAQNRVETACSALPPVDPANVVDPGIGAHDGERAWHHLLSGYESGYMYYGAALDMEIKATLACNRATELADPILLGATDLTPPTVWLPQRLPWNPGGFGAGALWGYPGGAGAPMPSDFHVWTFVHDAAGLTRIELMIREDDDGSNDPTTTANETYAGGTGVGSWSAQAMTLRPMPLDEPWPLGEIDFTVLPHHIADEAWVEVEGYANVLLDYYIEAEDTQGNVSRTPIQHVWVGDGMVNPGDPVVWTVPDTLVAGQPGSLFYDPEGRPLDGGATVAAHWGVNGWQQVTTTMMAQDGVTGIWSAILMPSAETTVLDVVFTDGAGVWDNNGGADWHLPVTGGQSSESPYVMDGAVDAVANSLSDCGTSTLWVSWQEPWLYVATDAPSAHTGRDVFLLVGGEAPAMAAPWAKSGLMLSWDAFLAAEGDNGWSGWFDAAETTPPSGRFDQVRGTVLEGALHLDDLYPSGRPDELRVAVGVYGTGDGGTLVAQCPLGDGDLDLISSGDYETVWVPVMVEATPELPVDFQLSAAPNPFNGHVSLRLDGVISGELTLSVHDLSGRMLRRLKAVAQDGQATATWDGRDRDGRPLPSGAYFVHAVQGESTAMARITYLK